MGSSSKTSLRTFTLPVIISLTSHTCQDDVCCYITHAPSAFTPIGRRAFLFISEAELDFVTKLSRIHGNIMRTNQVTGNMRPWTRGRLQPYHMC